jgi:hypothetical protein
MSGPAPTDVSQIEQQAQQLNQASVQGYGVAINPQLATEALLTNGTAPVSYTAALGDPSLQGVISSQPVGDSQFTTKGVPAPSSLYNDPFQFDPNSYKQYVQGMKTNGLNNSFESMGEAPMANLGWMNSILTGDPDTIKKWQTYLAQGGFYGTTSQDGKTFTKGAVNGYSSADFQTGFKNWALAYFLPQAIFSRDPQEQTNANQFLSGIGIDVNSIAQTMSFNPAQRTKVIDAWLQAQGPDGNNIDRLNAFAQHFGSAALPQQLNDLRGDGMFNSIGHFLGHIPGIGNLLGTTPDDLNKKLTPAEQEAMAPALQQAQQNSGFLGFLGDVFQAPSKALVTVGLFAKDAVTGQLGKDNINPFDSTSTVTKFVNNPMQMMFGDQFVKDHSWLATIGNVAANIVDDPFTALPFVGTAGLAEKIGAGLLGETDEAGNAVTQAAKVAAGKEKMTTVEKATGGLVSHRVGAIRMSYARPKSVIESVWHRDPETASLIGKALDPIGSSQQAIAKVINNPNMTVGLVRRILGVNTEEEQPVIDKLMAAIKDPAKGATDILSIIQDPRNAIGHRMFDMSLLTNRNEFHKIITNLEKSGLPDAKKLHAWSVLHMNDAPRLVNGKVDPSAALDAAMNRAIVAGMPQKEIADFEDKFWHSDPQTMERGDLFHAHMDAIDKHLDETLKDKGGIAKFQEWRNTIKAQKEDKPPVYAFSHDPGVPGKETSLREPLPNFTKGIPGTQWTADRLNQVVQHHDDIMNTIEAQWRKDVEAAAKTAAGDGVPITDDIRKQVVNSDPWLKAKAQTYQPAMEAAQGEIKALKDMADKAGLASAGEKVPAPMGTTQNYQWFYMPNTASEIAAYMNPALRQLNTVQKSLGIDNAMNWWKSLVLAKPATKWRVVIGDESSRGDINLLLNDFPTWLQYTYSKLKTHGKFLGIKGTASDTAGMEAIIKDMPPQLRNDFYGITHSEISDFDPMTAGSPGFRKGVTHLVENHYANWQWVKGWQKAVSAAAKKGEDWKAAGNQSITDFLLGDTKEAAELRQMAGVRNIKDLKKNPELQSLINTKVEDIEQFTHYDPAIKDRQHVFNWIKKGAVDQKQLKRLEQQTSQKTEDYLLPRIQGRSGLAHDVKGLLDHQHEQMAKAVNQARARVFHFKYVSARKRIDDFYKNADGTYGLAGDEQAVQTTIDRLARDEATNWVKKNTYQGARSMTGSMLRSVAPFWGATSNADHFYMRQMIEHPEVMMPTLQATQDISQAETQPGGLQMNIPGAAQLMSKFGLAAGDNFSFDPFNALFLTREGLGGFLPGMGPIFNLVSGAMPQSWQDFESQLPGMQYVSQGTPMLPWAEEILSGTEQLTGLGGGKGFEAPIIGRQEGYYSKQIDEKLQQLEANWEQSGRKGPAPTVQDAEKDYGVSRIVQGAAGLGAPLGVAAQNSTKNEIYTAEQEFSTEMSPADKAAFYAKYPDVADYFKYIDPSTPTSPEPGVESKDQILQKSPWVLAYATGTGVSDIPGKATVADTQQQYKLDVEQGNITTMDPTAYLTKMRTQEEMGQAWNEFDRLQATYQEWLQSSGVASTSAQAVMWKKQNYDPVLQSLVDDYPDWGQTFVKSTSTTSQPGLQIASEPFYSVSTFDVLPQNPALETKATILWRAALQRRDQAMSALSQIVSGGGPQIEKDMVLNGLAQQLDSLATQDPTFAAQLSRYRYSSVNDLLQYQANQAVATAQGFPT